MIVHQHDADGISRVQRQTHKPTVRVFTPSTDGFERFMYEMVGLLPDLPPHDRDEASKDRQRSHSR